MTILSTRLTNKKHDDDRLWVHSEPQELSGRVSSGSQATSYNRSDRWSNTTTDRDFINNYPIIRVSSHWDPNNEAWRLSNQEAINSSSKYSTFNRSTTITYDNNIRLLFIKPYSTSAETSAQSDRRTEPTRQIWAHTPELVYVEWSIINVPPPQKKLIQAQSEGHG
jgi:hypothetical protein